MTTTTTKTKAVATTKKSLPIVLAYGNVRAPKGAINAPKLSSMAIACNELTAFTKQHGKLDGALSMLGHKANCMGGVIDSVIASGKGHTIEAFISALANASHIKSVNNVLDTQGGYNDFAKACFAHRVSDHVQWCANNAMSHKGFVSRLAKVGLATHAKQLSTLLTELATQLKNAYSVQYAALYRKRAK